MRRQARCLHPAISALGGLVLGLLWLQSAQASCGNRPGTPNETEIYAISGNQLEFRWRNTTGKGLNPSGSIGRNDQPHVGFFDIYVRNAAGQPVGADVTGGARQNDLVYGKRSRYIISGLVPNTPYCASLRARDAANREGCVSQLASATVCAKTLGPGQSLAAPMFDPYRPSASAPPPQPSFPAPPRPEVAGCVVVATVRVESCTNPTGEAAQYFEPMTLTGCGKNKDDALKVAAGSGLLCLSDEPGCCKYNAAYTDGPAASVMNRLQLEQHLEIAPQAPPAIGRSRILEQGPAFTPLQ